MTAGQLVKPLQIISEVQRRRVGEAVLTPGVRQAMKEASAGILGPQLREQLQSQIDFQKMLRPGLLDHMLEQNAAIRQMLQTPGIQRALASIDFKLPDGLVDDLVAFRDQLATEVADPDGAGERVGRLAQEREAIITCLRRIRITIEGFNYLPGSPIPPLVAFLIFFLAALAEISGEVLTRRERGDDE